MINEVAVMARLYNRSDDMDDSDDISMDEPVDDVSNSDAADMASSREDAPEARSVTSRCRIRDQLNHDIEAYLASGGAIHPADNRVKNDAPHGSGGHYGNGGHYNSRLA
jgi:hypothetical protein